MHQTVSTATNTKLQFQWFNSHKHKTPVPVVTGQFQWSLTGQSSQLLRHLNVTQMIIIHRRNKLCISCSQLDATIAERLNIKRVCKSVITDSAVVINSSYKTADFSFQMFVII